MNATYVAKFPSGPKRRFPGEFLLKMRANPTEALTGLSQHGPVVGLKAGQIHVIFLSQPELIHEVLVTRSAEFGKGEGLKALKRMLGEGLLTSEGALHKTQRQLLQPVFQAQKVGVFAPAVVGRSQYLLSHWPDEGVISASPEMTRLTMQIVGECLFGTDLENDVSEVRQALGEAMNLFRVANLPFARWLETLYPPLRRKIENSRGRLDAVIMRMIGEHRRCPHQDLLGKMMESPMSEQQLRDEAMTLFLAGHETTAHALTFALYLLSRHPAEQESLRQEVVQVAGKGPLQIEHVPQLLRLKDALQETMRLYPPAWAMGRMALRETHLGGYLVPKGCTILMSQYVMHRKAEYFPEPERFIPQRWQQRPRTSLPKLCYFPFGAGPRVCIGEHFAWLEMLLGLGTILQNYQLMPCPVEKPRLRTRVTMSPEGELLIPVRRLT